MTTLTDYRAYYEVQARVDLVRGRMRALRLTQGVLAFVAILCGAVLVATVLQGFLRFGPMGRLTILVAGAATVAIAFWYSIIAPLRFEPNEKEAARFIETRLQELGNSLINTILLAEHADEWSGPMVGRAIGEAAAAARPVDLMRALSADRVRQWGMAAAVSTTLLAAFVLLAWPRFRSAALQVLSPMDRTIASVGAARIIAVRPGNAEWTRGEPLDIEVAIADPKGRLYDGTVFIAEDSGAPPVEAPLLRGADRPDRFTYRVAQVLQPFTYRASVGGTESKTFRIALRQAPLIRQIDVRYVYPEYTGLEPQTVTNNGGEVRCLVGTDVEMTIQVSAPVETASLVFASGPVLKCLPSKDGLQAAGRFTVLADDTYQIRLQGETPNGAAVVYRIVALPDDPPLITFTFPRGDIVAGLGETVKMSLKAADKYGLGSVQVLVQGDADAAPAVLKEWRQFADPKEAMLDHALVLAADRYRLGQTATCWAAATDRRTYQGGKTPREPNRAETPKFKILIQDRKKAAEEKLQELSRLFDRLREILKAQEQARTMTSAVLSSKPLQEVRTVGAALALAQRTVRDATVALTNQVAFDESSLPIKETLLVLAANEMASALVKASALADLKDPARLDQAPEMGKALAADQDAIIQVLRRILDILPKLADAVREDLASVPVSDLPPEALAKLKDLRDRLKEFTEEQKKVIEASKDLAKKPVDDFQDTDQRKLEALKAIEDQWDKFLTEKIADFSKVPDLDASNPSLVKELIEVKTDVEMASDALSKKAMDVVVPLEELGMEAAEEIVENLERWLPDTPDREKWQQEEATGDAEIPHAQLPEQMEDLVGDLLEQEEDLFEEIEDVTSGAGDSADKGAGWDAMDGPISNYSAKGVTGNRLPNTSEVGGRSGEGRTGKSSGEFVEEEAAGKGGRRTPTRLSPDAFSKGEVKDSSPEAPTGATGGGKISGAGSEGLEGPVPAEVQRRMGSLAGKQAQLRNKAEGVKAGLEVKNYQAFALEEAINGMRRVQRDLLAGRYSNALRQRDIVLDNLKSSKMLLGGEVRIRRDSSASLPNEVQDEVLDALEKPMPRGYEEFLKRYYERLSEGK
jgi:hypothetical protein